jgi:hypothetical protein
VMAGLRGLEHERVRWRCVAEPAKQPSQGHEGNTARTS